MGSSPLGRCPGRPIIRVGAMRAICLDRRASATGGVGGLAIHGRPAPSLAVRRWSLAWSCEQSAGSSPQPGTEVGLALLAEGRGAFLGLFRLVIERQGLEPQGTDAADVLAIG